MASCEAICEHGICAIQDLHNLLNKYKAFDNSDNNIDIKQMYKAEDYIKIDERKVKLRNDIREIIAKTMITNCIPDKTNIELTESSLLSIGSWEVGTAFFTIAASMPFVKNRNPNIIIKNNQNHE